MNIPARYYTGYPGDIGVPPVPYPMDLSAWFEGFLGDRWHTFDVRHNVPRIGRIVMARGRDAGDVPITMCFGHNALKRFEVTTYELGATRHGALSHSLARRARGLPSGAQRFTKWTQQCTNEATPSAWAPAPAASRLNRAAAFG